MTLTLTELGAVVSEIAGVVNGGTIQGIDQPSPSTVDVKVATTTGSRTIRFNIRPGLSRVHLLQTHETVSSAGYSTFAERARGLLIGGFIERVAMQYGDRVAALAVRTGEGPRTLLFECSGHHPNLFVLDERRLILAVLGQTTSRKRHLAVGHVYEKPLRHATDGIDTLRFVSAPGHLSEAIEEAYRSQDARQDRLDAIEHLKRALARILQRVEAGHPLNLEASNAMRSLLLGEEAGEKAARDLIERLERIDARRRPPEDRKRPPDRPVRRR